MKITLRRIRAALLMGLTWAVPWLFVAALMELFVDPHGKIADIWPAVLGLPAFLAGVFLSVVLGIAERRRRFDELSVPRFAACGAVAGLLVSVLPFVLGSANGSAWRPWVLIMVPMTARSAVVAAGSLALARTADRYALPDNADVATAQRPTT